MLPHSLHGSRNEGKCWLRGRRSSCDISPAVYSLSASHIQPCPFRIDCVTVLHQNTWFRFVDTTHLFKFGVIRPACKQTGTHTDTHPTPTSLLGLGAWPSLKRPPPSGWDVSSHRIKLITQIKWIDLQGVKLCQENTPTAALEPLGPLTGGIRPARLHATHLTSSPSFSILIKNQDRWYSIDCLIVSWRASVFIRLMHHCL